MPLFAREALGLVWLSVEEDPAAPFPLSAEWFSGDWSVGWRRVTVSGHPLAWLDHNLDAGHMVINHNHSMYTGDSEHLPRTILDIHSEVEPRYPFCPGKLVLENATIHSFWLHYSLAGSPLAALRGLFRNEQPKISLEGLLLSPAVQRVNLEYRSRFGAMGVMALNILNPINSGRSDFYLFVAIPPLHWPLRGAQMTYALNAVAERHVLDEDAPFLSRVETFASETYYLTPHDRPFVMARDALAHYVGEKASIYPASSYMHQLGQMPLAFDASRYTQTEPAEPAA